MHRSRTKYGSKHHINEFLTEFFNLIHLNRSLRDQSDDILLLAESKYHCPAFSIYCSYKTEITTILLSELSSRRVRMNYKQIYQPKYLIALLNVLDEKK